MQKQEREASEKYMHAYKALPESVEEIEAARTVRCKHHSRRRALDMKRGEIWWADLDHLAGRRPVAFLSRDEAYLVNNTHTRYFF